jgi:arylsulfatase A-like enzyme/Tfp pilus assembly protein PilF
VDTPHIDALAGQSVLFERAYSHYPLTLPSHGGGGGGQLPPVHGVRNNKGYALEPGASTLAERLASTGYRTAGFVSSMVLRRGTGIEQGFEHYEEPGRQPGLDPRQAFAQQPGEKTLAGARGWLEARGGDEKLFVFFHVFDPHTPHAAPAPMAQKYEDAYDAEVAYSDSVVGGLFDVLRAKGRFDDALIVLLSDHGEGLGDHVEREHGIFLYREALQVPLIVKLPGGRRAGERVKAPVGLADVAPTVLALLGLETAGSAGVPLFAGEPPGDRVLYAETSFGHDQYGWSPLKSALHGSEHYIQAPRPELYDLAEDPGEKTNLLPGRPVPKRLAGAIAAAGEGKRTTAAVSPEQEERLAALGYVGGPSAAAPAGADLPDPKDRVAEAMELWALMDRIGKDESAGTEVRVLELLGTTGLKREELNRTVAGNLMGAGRLAAALTALEPFRDSPAVETQLLRGEVLARLGRARDARTCFERALAADPRSPQAHRNLGILLLGDGRMAEARRWLEKAVELDAGQAEAWNGLGVIQSRSGDAAGAVAAWRRAVEADPTLADAWYNLAGTLAGLGRQDEARVAIERYAAAAHGPEREKALAILARMGPARR